MMFPLENIVALQAENERVKALKKSTVKIKANDVIASFKLVTYFALLPIYVGLFTFAYYMLLTLKFEFSLIEAYWHTLLFFFLFPVIQSTTITFHDRVSDNYSEFQGRFLSLFYTGQVELIQQTRKVLKKKVRAAVDKVGPHLYKNFDTLRMVMFDPKSSPKKKKQRERAPEQEQNKLQKS